MADRVKRAEVGCVRKCKNGLIFLRRVAFFLRGFDNAFIKGDVKDWFGSGVIHEFAGGGFGGTRERIATDILRSVGNQRNRMGLLTCRSQGSCGVIWCIGCLWWLRACRGFFAVRELPCHGGTGW